MPRPFLFFSQTCWYPNQWLGILWDGSVVFFEEREHYVFAGQGNSVVEAMRRSGPLYSRLSLANLFLETGSDLLQ